MGNNSLYVISGILFLISFIPYITAILYEEIKSKKGKIFAKIIGVTEKTNPRKVSWIIWAVLDSITLAGMLLKYSINGQIIGAVIGAWVVVILTTKYGESGWDWLDIFCLSGAVVGIVIMFVNPVYAIATSLSVVFLGSFPTFKSAWKNPKNENRVAWTIYWLSCVVATIAIPKWDFQHAAQPLTFLAIESIMMYILYFHHPLQKQEE